MRTMLRPESRNSKAPNGGSSKLYRRDLRPCLALPMDPSGPGGETPRGEGPTQKGGESLGAGSRRSTRLQPKRRASIDQAPGPSNASAAPVAANRNERHGSSPGKKRFNTPSAAMSAAATGVQRPTATRIPTPSERAWKKIAPGGGPAISPSMACTTSAKPAASLRSRSPAPAGPWANVESSRRTSSTLRVACNDHQPRRGIRGALSGLTRTR